MMVNDQSNLAPMNVPSIHFEWLTWTCQQVGMRMNVSYCEDWCYESTRLLFYNAVIANPVFLQICNLRLNISWMWSWILQTSPLWTTSGTSWAKSALFRLCMALWISQTSMSSQVRTELTQLTQVTAGNHSMLAQIIAQGCLGSAQNVFWHLSILPEYLL